MPDLRFVLVYAKGNRLHRALAMKVYVLMSGVDVIGVFTTEALALQTARKIGLRSYVIDDFILK
jgi:uncharacterized membrane protein